MKSFNQFVNEVKLQKSSGYKKGDKLVFNNPTPNRKAKVFGHKEFTGVVAQDAGRGEDVRVVSPEYKEAYGDSEVMVSPERIKTKVV